MALNLDVIGKRIGPVTTEYTWKDVVLYALGVGAGFDELDYVYENRLKVIPSFAVPSTYGLLGEAFSTLGGDLSGILHGEQETLFQAPIPTEGKITSEGRVLDIYDKGPGRGAIVLVEVDTHHASGQKLYTNRIKLFFRKDGGFGGEPGPEEVFEFPDRPPDLEERADVSPNQPLLYRLSGDTFALHVDPDFARMAGFQMPIVHGLCTHGFACRAVIKHLFPGEPERMSRFKVRFSRPLYPGRPVVTQIWKVDDGQALFRVINPENQDVVIDRGVVEWLSQGEMARRARLGGIHFDGRVALVTGAGAGLGRVYALELARRGAKVVVNDLGGGRDGTGGSRSAADGVVEEIRAFGGEAVANYDSVASAEGGQAMVDEAVRAFGRLDILINNAGILRDRTLVKMEPGEWDAVMDVHLKGAYNVTRPAFVRMREQGYGRIVMTTSAAGLYGNFGQTNYSAAKMGLVGFMNTVRLEGAKYNIRVNTVAPAAATRLTEDVMPPELFAKLKPEFVAPLVLYLCSEQCPVSGGIYNAGMGYFNRVALVTGPGAVVGEGLTAPLPEAVAAAMGKINSLAGGGEYPNATAALGAILEAWDPKKAKAEAEAEGGAGGLTVRGIFEKMAGAFQADKAGGVDVVFQYVISGPGGGTWHVVVKDGACRVAEGAHERPTTTIKMGDEDFVKMISGQLKAMAAYTSGKLKVEGDLMKSQLIEKLFRF